MSILKVIISFIIISYVAAINVAIASTPEQEVLDVKVQSEQKDKSIDSSPDKKQELSNVKTQSEQKGSDSISHKETQSTIIKSNEVSKNQTENLLNPNNKIRAIVKLKLRIMKNHCGKTLLFMLL